MIKQSSIEELKAHIDILSVIGHYIELKKMGANYGARCPFHDEKTASFMVSKIKNIFHCYGCGVGGDGIKFVMEYAKLSYPQAIEQVAEIMDFSLEYEERASKTNFESDYRALELIFNKYHKNLLANKDMMDYLYARGLNLESIKNFNLGFCENSSEILRFCKENDISIDNMIKLGVLGENNSRTYARFLERIIFPIYNSRNKPIALGGRSLQDGVAKYINSQSSYLFNKSHSLYGYNLAKDAIHREKRVILCEGYLDVIMLHQAGFKSAVATLGTSLNEGHVKILKRSEAKIIVAYDADKAGLQAALRASYMLHLLDGGVVFFDSGLDPADMVKDNKINELVHKFNSPIPFAKFIINKIPQKYDLTNTISRQAAFNELYKYLSSLPIIMQHDYRAYAAKMLGVDHAFFKLNDAGVKRDVIPMGVNSKSTLELDILKGLLEDKSAFEHYLHVLDERLFNDYKDEFRALQDGAMDKLSAIEISMQKAPSGENLKSDIQKLLLLRSKNLKKQIILDASLTQEQKDFYIHKITDNMMQLKNGKLLNIYAFLSA